MVRASTRFVDRGPRRRRSRRFYPHGYRSSNPDTVGDLELTVRDLDVDAVIAPACEHLDLVRLARVCEILTLTPEAIHYRDGRREPLA